jgi:hypothetical protein
MPDDRIRVPGQQTVTRRLLRKRNEYLIAVPEHDAIGLADHGSMWRDRRHPSRTARLLGVVRNRDGRIYAMTVRCLDGKFWKYRKRRWDRFKEEWQRIVDTAIPWEIGFTSDGSGAVDRSGNLTGPDK